LEEISEISERKESSLEISSESEEDPRLLWRPPTPRL